MALARWQRTVTDEEGNVLDAASIEVRTEAAGNAIVSLFSDREGVTPMGNPFNADSEGFAFFHVPGGSYQITATKDGVSQTWRYVGIGLLSEADGIAPGVPFTFDDATSDVDPGAGQIRLNNATLGSVTTIYVDNTEKNGSTITTWLDSFDDGGSSGNRGTLTLMSAGGLAMLLCRVTGSVVDGTGYRKISVTVLASVGTFLADETLFLSFAGRGTDGTGDVNGPSGGVIDGEITVYDGTGGKTIKANGSSRTVANVGAGKQTIWVPAGAMLPRVSNPASVAILDSGSNDLTVSVLDFDQTTAEFAHFTVAFPKQWDEGTVTFQPFWTAAAGTATQTAILSLAGVAISNDDVVNASFGTAQTSSDALIATGDLHVGPESSAITIGGTPAESDLVVFQVARDISDTLAADLRLIGIKLHFTTNANTDA